MRLIEFSQLLSVIDDLEPRLSSCLSGNRYVYFQAHAVAPLHQHPEEQIGTMMASWQFHSMRYQWRVASPGQLVTALGWHHDGVQRRILSCRGLSAPIAIIFDAVSFLVSALCVWLIRTPEPPLEPTEQRQPLWRDVAEGRPHLLECGSHFRHTFAT
jgi:hypothetical protein